MLILKCKSLNRPIIQEFYRVLVVRQYIIQRRYESLNLHAVLQGFSTTDCDWTLPAKLPRVYQPASVAESAKRRELVEEFLYWYFDSFILPLLRASCFTSCLLFEF